MTRVQKAACFIGVCGIGVAFGGIKMAFLGWTGLATVLASASVYALDKYLCSSADMILEIDIEAAQEFERPDERVVPEPENKESHQNVTILSYVDTDGVCPPPVAPVTYSYDVISGQWDAASSNPTASGPVKYKRK